MISPNIPPASSVAEMVCRLVLKNPTRSDDEIAKEIRTTEKFVRTGRRILRAAGKLPSSGRLNPVGRKICELLRQNSQRSDKDIAAEVQRVCNSKTKPHAVTQHRAWLRAASSISQK